MGQKNSSSYGRIMKELEKNKPSFLVEILEGRSVRMELKIETDSVIINSSSDESYGRIYNAIFISFLMKHIVARDYMLLLVLALLKNARLWYNFGKSVNFYHCIWCEDFV